MVGTTEKELILVLADISGYSTFMTSHKKALAHGQMIITELLQEIIREAENVLHVSKLEGDAVFFYAEREGAGGRKDNMGETLLRFFDVFHGKLGDLKAFSMCTCDACINVDRLRLKVIAHSGEALFYNIGGFSELSGVDVILAHRLLKNSVQADEYILMTDLAHQDIPLSQKPDMEGEETYDALDPIKIHVYFPRIRGNGDADQPSFPNATVDILRYEVRKKYCEVAHDPYKGFHFHTGLPLAQKLGYRQEWLDGLPQTAVESLAGTGNPFSPGELEPGWKVVDVGSGSGTDSLIAARMVGEKGYVIGVDMTPEMLRKSQKAAEEAGLKQVEFREGYAESLPVEDRWADAVISNGVLNLCPDKSLAYREIFRVLKPGGKLQAGDILVEKPVPEGAKRDTELWTD